MEKPMSLRKVVLKGALTANCSRWRPIDFSDAPTAHQDRSDPTCNGNEAGEDEPGAPALVSDVPVGKVA